MANALKLFCGVFGSAVIFPVSLLGVVSAVASPLSQGSVPRTVVVIALSLLANIGALASLGFTILNCAAPENALRKPAGWVVLVTGAIAIVPMGIMMANSTSAGFIAFLGFVTLSSVALVFSGLLQTGMVKMK